MTSRINVYLTLTDIVQSAVRVSTVGVKKNPCNQKLLDSCQAWSEL